ncbi:hypothetical protein L484_014207 [Morus notabilis]|uniref:Uncharacterized protein n=1 Tax=Morus notabilis TaxID=981085 RepID=W9RSF5_9ROSA|nr:hypothetical protein L484_014207 [Morus notabilis]
MATCEEGGLTDLGSHRGGVRFFSFSPMVSDILGGGGVEEVAMEVGARGAIVMGWSAHATVILEGVDSMGQWPLF